MVLDCQSGDPGSNPAGCFKIQTDFSANTRKLGLVRDELKWDLSIDFNQICTLCIFRSCAMHQPGRRMTLGKGGSVWLEPEAIKAKHM